MQMTSELGENPTENDSILAILRIFYKTDKRPWNVCVNEFNKLIAKPCKEKIFMQLDFENLPAEYYIFADTYSAKLDLLNLYNHLSDSKEKSISLAKATKVKQLYLESVDYLKEKYEWIFNPPQLPGINKETIGKQFRAEFKEYYGSYAEITYLLASGDALKFDKVNQMKLSDYLALGEYLIRKRAVESIS